MNNLTITIYVWLSIHLFLLIPKGYCETLTSIDNPDSLIDLPAIVFDMAQRTHVLPPTSEGITDFLRSQLYTPPESPAFNRETTTKDAQYIDVHPDRLILYPSEQVISWENPDEPDQRISEHLDAIEEHRDTQYIVLLIRPHSSAIYRQLARLIRARGIDMALELIEADRPVDHNERSRSNSFPE